MQGLSFVEPDGDRWHKFGDDLKALAPVYFEPYHQQAISLVVGQAYDAARAVVYAAQHILERGDVLDRKSMVNDLFNNTEFQGGSESGRLAAACSHVHMPPFLLAGITGARVKIDSTGDTLARFMVTNFQGDDWTTVGEWVSPSLTACVCSARADAAALCCRATRTASA